MTITGMESLKRAISAAPDVVKKEASRAIRESTIAVADRMRRLAPVRSGALKAAIATKLPTGSGLVGLVFFDDPRVFYWKFLEYGTVRIPPRPFVRPSAEAEAPRYIARMEAAGSAVEAAMASRRGSSTGGGLV